MQVEGITFSNISATTANFILAGGVYAFSTVWTQNGNDNVNLTRLAADGSTYQTAHAFSANALSGGQPAVNLPAGQYRIEFPGSSGPTAAYIEILRAG